MQALQGLFGKIALTQMHHKGNAGILNEQTV